MKKQYYLLYGIITLLLFACKSEDKYQTSIVRNFDFYLNGEQWFAPLGQTGRQILIYHPDGGFAKNYMTYYRFALENGSYKFLASPTPTMITDSLLLSNLNDLVIKQPVNANFHVQISPVINYSSPFSDTLHFKMVNRTGTLRLRAKDLNADLSYTTIRAIVTVKYSGYKVIDESYIDSAKVLIRSKITTTGGLNYTEDFIVFNTLDDQHKVSVRIELLDAGGQVIRTKDLPDQFEILPNQITLADFYLNE